MNRRTFRIPVNIVAGTKNPFCSTALHCIPADTVHVHLCEMGLCCALGLCNDAF